MPYNYTYINKQHQFEEITYTLVLEDSDMILPVVRVEKTFKESSVDVDDTLLFNEAQAEILRVLSEPPPETILATSEGKG